ncbi:MAG: hypothetical protein SFV54_09425 [Bryobacteraceae bacterium]|nr:hypothetical protein [Bryobacteraceae bacterium]
MRLLSLVFCASALLLAEQAGGIKWTAPAAWKAQAGRPMRAATYTVPATAGDPEPGEVAVFYFGPGQGGGVEANIQRWVGQFQTADGKPAAGKEKTGKRTVNGIPVTTIDLTGTYTAAGGPMATTKSNKPNYRLLGAIAEGSQGAVFFKFTGPAKTVAANQPGFEALIKSLAK